MTVSELIDRLKDFPNDAVVLTWNVNCNSPVEASKLERVRIGIDAHMTGNILINPPENVQSQPAVRLV